MNNKLILKPPVNLDKMLKKSAKTGANLTEFERDYLVRLCGDFRGQMTREIPPWLRFCSLNTDSDDSGTQDSHMSCTFMQTFE